MVQNRALPGAMEPLLGQGWGEEPRVLLLPSAIPLPGTPIDRNLLEAQELGECPVQTLVPTGYTEHGRGGSDRDPGPSGLRGH